MKRTRRKRTDLTEISDKEIIAINEPIVVFDKVGHRVKSFDILRNQYSKHGFVPVKGYTRRKISPAPNIPEPISLDMDSRRMTEHKSEPLAREPGTVEKVYEQKPDGGYQAHSLPPDRPRENQELIKRAESPRYRERWVRCPSSHERIRDNRNRKH